MIKSFADKRTAALFAGHVVKGFPHQIQRRAKAKLQALDATKRLDDLSVPPGNRLKALPPGSPERGARKPTQHPHQRSVAALLDMARWRGVGGRGRRLPLD